MYHSITIGNKNTWTDWFLIPASRPVINPPEPRYHFLDVPGANGQLDLTEAMFGEITYGSREGTWDFYVDNGHVPWHQNYSNIMEYIHGKRVDIMLEDDPDYIYQGRVKINEWRSEPERSQISIDYILDPYKLTKNFVVDETFSVNPSSNLYKYYTTGSMITYPSFYTTSSNMSVTYSSVKYTIPRNVDKPIYGVRLPAKTRSALIFRNENSSAANVRVRFRNGVL